MRRDKFGSGARAIIPFSRIIVGRLRNKRWFIMFHNTPSVAFLQIASFGITSIIKSRPRLDEKILIGTVTSRRSLEHLLRFGKTPKNPLKAETTICWLLKLYGNFLTNKNILATLDIKYFVSSHRGKFLFRGRETRWRRSLGEMNHGRKSRMSDSDAM